jgi:hypothetical protein
LPCCHVKPPRAACPVASLRPILAACLPLPSRLTPHTLTPGQQEPSARAFAAAGAAKRPLGGGAEAGTGDTTAGRALKRVKAGPAMATKPPAEPKGEPYVHGSSC